MSDSRIIKKYPNRRLYDTVLSRYITLGDVRALVHQHLPFRVIEQRTGRDLTRSVMLQVIAEQEQHAGAILSEDFLAQLICGHDAGSADLISSYLEQALRLYLEQRLPAEPASLEDTGRLAIGNFERWQQVQEQIYRTLQAAAAATADGKALA
ncbi:MAG: polyhydroxyalkanoate synthesis repressor PhaR [Gammaproteobacteria bacterium]|nr:polyhydroxyalkanoate synthesis repressor PhaR [Gammaproteobacteria bacterium]